MRIRFDQATAEQLRRYLADRFGVETHHFSKPPSLINKIRELDAGAGEDFELTDEVAAAPVDEVREEEAGRSDAEPSVTQKLIDALVETHGMSREEAEHVAGRAMLARQNTRQMPTGEAFDRSWFTIELKRTEEAGGNDPVPVSVNGRNQLIPRGEHVPIRAPYVEVLQHAEKIVYDEVMEADGIRSRMVPRVVQQFPFDIISGPYGEEEARRLLADRRSAQAA